MSILTAGPSVMRRACSSPLALTRLALAAPSRSLSASCRLAPPWSDHPVRARNSAGYASSARQSLALTSLGASASAVIAPTRPAGVYGPPRPRPRPTHPSPSPSLARYNPSRGIAITATAPAMYSQPPPAPGHDFNVMMVGAGVSGGARKLDGSLLTAVHPHQNIMFGSDEGPWK